MAIANNIYAYLASGPDQGSRVDQGGFTVQVPASADSGAPIKVDLQYWRSGLTYVSTDVLYLTARRTVTVGGISRTYEVEYPLTYTGNLWVYTPDTTHFVSCGIEPGESVTWDARLQLRSDTGTGAAPVASTKSFTLTVDRAAQIAPGLFGNVVGHYSAWDLANLYSYGDDVTTWYDRSGLERNLTEATNKPKLQYDVNGRPHCRFDGTNDVLATTQLFPATGTVLAVCRYRAIPVSPTLHPAVTWGASSIGGFYLNTTNANASWDVAGSVTSVAASPTATPNVQEWFVCGATKTDDGSQNVIYNLTAGTASGTEANAPGVLRAGHDGVLFGNVDIAEIVFFDTVLAATFTGNLEDAVRALHSAWSIGV